MKCNAIWIDKDDETELPPCQGELMRVADDIIICDTCEARWDLHQ